MKQYLNKLDPLTRRRFVSKLAKTTLGVSVLPWGMSRAEIEAEPPNPPGGGKAKHLIYLYMGGGMSHIDTFDPKSDSETKGPTDPIPTNADGVFIANNLPLLAKQMDKMAFIRSMTTKTGVHESGTYYMKTGYQPRSTIVHPTVGPWAQKLLGKQAQRLPDSVTINGGPGPGAGFMEPSFAPVPIFNPNSGLQYSKITVAQKDFDHRISLADEFDHEFRNMYDHSDVKAYTDFYDQTLALLRSEDLKAFDLKEESSDMREKYGTSGFGQGCLLARRLVEHGVRYIEVNHGGWDMHNGIGQAMTNNGGLIDGVISTLIQDLEAKGLLKDTLIVVGTEFGRTPVVNQNAGRDHHPAVFSTMFAGGGIKGGSVYGSSGKKGINVEENPVGVPDFISTIGWALGLPLDKIIYSPSGRPFSVGDKGRPITEIFG
jgi:hypothetical protein